MERVWVYQANRFFKADEIASIRSDINTFVDSWTAHGAALDAKADLKEDLFIILVVDENQASVSGCSIDKSVHFLKALGEKYAIDFFDRMKIAFRNTHGEVSLVDRSEFERLIKDGIVNENTIVFNNLVQTVGEYLENWEVPFKDSWHSKVF